MRLNKHQIPHKIVRVQEAMKTSDGSYPPDDQVFRILDEAGMVSRIERFVLQRFQSDVNKSEQIAEYTGRERHRTELLSRKEQYDEQMRDLYDRSTGGDIQAKKLWFDMFGGEEQEQEFNIVVKIDKYTIRDNSLPSIAKEAEPQVVSDIFSGIDERMKLDEAPHELRDQFREFVRQFSLWANRAYAPKDA